MKILLVSAYFPPDTGSAANLFYDMGRYLVKEGHSVSVLTSFPSYHVAGQANSYAGQGFVKEAVDGMAVHRVPVPRFPRHIPAMRALWQFSMSYCFARLAGRLDKHDVCLVYSPPLPLGLVGGVLRRKNACPFVLNVQDLFPQSAIDLGLLRNKILIRLFQYLERRIYRSANHITVHSDGNKAHVDRTGIDDPKKTTVVPNWIDTDFIRPGPKANPFSKRYGLVEKFVVSFAGVLGYSQDIDVILNAAAMLKGEKEKVFVIVGDGVEKGRLARKARDMRLDNVLFLPMQSRDVYPHILNSSDVCLSTLKKDVLSPVVPSKILSIMAAGKPLVACMNLNGDAPAIIHQAKCGYVFPAGDSRSLAKAVQKLYDEPDSRREYGANGRDYCVTNFSLDICTDRYTQLFERLRNSKR
jgi:colanic acid biosynthesis glycosyl transferase WcaI